VSDINLSTERENLNNKKQKEFKTFCASVCICYEALLDIVEAAIDMSTTASASTSFGVSGVTSRQAGSGTGSRDEDSGLSSSAASTSYPPSLTASAITVSTEKYSLGQNIENNAITDPGSAFTPAIDLLDDITEKDRGREGEKSAEKRGEEEKGGEKGEKQKGGEKEILIVTTPVKTPLEFLSECVGNEGEGGHSLVTLEPSASRDRDLGPDDVGSLALSVSVSASLPPSRNADSSVGQDNSSLIFTPSPITPETVRTLTHLP
jgi:hypothetical protein